MSGASARPAPKVPAEKAHRGAKRIVTGEEISTRELASRDIPVLEVVVPMAPFPSRSDVRVGMSRSEIIARFGEPDASATWSDEGTLSEKFIYKRTERSSEILIRAGRVVAMRRAVPVR